MLRKKEKLNDARLGFKWLWFYFILCYVQDLFFTVLCGWVVSSRSETDLFDNMYGGFPG